MIRRRPSVAVAFAMFLAATQVLRAGPLEDLKAYLAKSGDLKTIGDQAWATAPLSKADAGTARDLLWADFVARNKPDAEKEIAAKAFTLKDKTLKLKTETYGTKPKDGWALFISMHGGGSAPAEVNDSQWSNQHHLYKLKDAIVVAPRAPTDAWNMWHDTFIDDLFDHVIQDYVLAGEVDPNHVYIIGYSAGGDGVYQLAPRMADRWAAAGMMAGHPNDASPLGLRNLPFALHVGALDAAYKRNDIAKEWGKKLDDLQAADAGGYKHQVELHAGRPHWMNLEEQKTAIPWIRGFERNPWPSKVVWHQSNRTHDRLYWLLDGHPTGGTDIVAEVKGQTITFSSPTPPASVRPANADKPLTFPDTPGVVLDDGLISLDKPVTLRTPAAVYTFTPKRTIASLSQSLEKRADKEMMGATVVQLPGGSAIAKGSFDTNGMTVTFVPVVGGPGGASAPSSAKPSVDSKAFQEATKPLGQPGTLTTKPSMSEPSAVTEPPVATEPPHTTMAPAALDAAVAYLQANLAPADKGKLSPDYLREDARLAVAARLKSPWGPSLPTELFNEYVLSYRNFDETQENWRPALEPIAREIIGTETDPGKAGLLLNKALFKKVNVQYHPTKRPRPNQSPAESIEAGYASCSGLSILLVDACRAVAIPARVVGTPNWSTGKGDVNGNHNGNHTWVEIWDGQQWRFIGASEDGQYDKTWFNDNASKANATHPIFAAAFTRSADPKADFFPMVWDMDSRAVPGVNVTDYYAERVQVTLTTPKDQTIEIRDPAIGNRLVARLSGTTAEPTTLALAGGRKYTASIGAETKEISVTAEKTQTLDLTK